MQGRSSLIIARHATLISDHAVPLSISIKAKFGAPDDFHHDDDDGESGKNVGEARKRRTYLAFLVGRVGTLLLGWDSWPWDTQTTITWRSSDDTRHNTKHIYEPK